MAVQNYQTINLIEGRSQWKSVPASSSAYVYFEATHLDSVYGIYLSVIGVTAGAGTPVISVEQSINSNQNTQSAAVWSEVTAPVDFKGSPVNVVIKCIPTATETLYPFLRLKITTDATSSAVISTIQRTIRGAN